MKMKLEKNMVLVINKKIFKEKKTNLVKDNNNLMKNCKN